MALLFQSTLWGLLFLVFFIYSFRFPDLVLVRSKQFFYIILFYSGFLFLTSNIKDRNVYLSYYALASLPWILLFKNKTIRYIGVLFIIYIVVYAEKRGGFLALLFSITIYLFIENYIFKKEKGLGIFYVIFSSGFVLFIFLQLSQIAESMIFKRIGMIKKDEGSGRMEIYENLFNAIKKFDVYTLIFGNGHNSVTNIIQTFAHNEFLQIMVDYGIVGLFLYITLHILLIKKCFALLKERSPYASSFVASYILFLTIAMVSHWFVMALFVIILVSYWGIIFGLTEKNKLIKFKMN